jgi:hypothetical protein
MDVRKADLDRPISYYKLIAPNLWSEVEANAMKKLQNNIKRRPGTIGVAPDMIGKQRAAAPGAPAAKAAAAPAAAAAAPAAPVAAVGKNMSPEKLAKLEAIRAAKRAQRGEVVGSVAGAVPIDPGSETASVEMGTHTEESATGLRPTAADTSAPSAPVAAVGQNMPEDKKARLEAIRAAKRAQREQGG